MSRSTIIRRGAVGGVAAFAAVALAASPALAHHCYIPMYSLNGPASANWEVITAEAGAAEFGIFVAECDEQVDAGYDALRDAGLPVGIKIKISKTIGDPKEEGRIPNPNGANGKGLEYFGAGSTLADDMLTVWVDAASSHGCG